MDSFKSSGTAAVLFGLGVASLAALLMLDDKPRYAKCPVEAARDARGTKAAKNPLRDAARLRAAKDLLSPTVIKKLDRIWVRYSKTSPAIKALLKDPDVKQLIAKYQADKDLDSLAKEAARSRSLRRLGEQALWSPDAVDMAFELIRAIPPDTLRKAAAQFKVDPRMVELAMYMARRSGPGRLS
ncbi:MAG: hypothetical protein NTX64_12415 [Elusimicrobia bacterium]|nr:hypothetical protein [Elusimicrobiota bacterium]